MKPPRDVKPLAAVPPWFVAVIEAERAQFLRIIHGLEPGSAQEDRYLEALQTCQTLCLRAKRGPEDEGVRAEAAEAAPEKRSAFPFKVGDPIRLACEGLWPGLRKGAKGWITGGAENGAVRLRIWGHPGDFSTNPSNLEIDPDRKPLERLEVVEESELAPLREEMAKGRAKYPNGCTVLSLLDEVGEVAHAVNKYQGVAHVRDELLDVAAVAMRLYLGEIDRGLTIDGLEQRKTDDGERSVEPRPLSQTPQTPIPDVDVSYLTRLACGKDFRTICGNCNTASLDEVSARVRAETIKACAEVVVKTYERAADCVSILSAPTIACEIRAAIEALATGSEKHVDQEEKR